LEVKREAEVLKGISLREYDTKNDIMVTGGTYVDATYEGDLAALAKVPYRSLLPQGVDNLILPVCLSATHVAWVAVRLEPFWLQIDEAAGFAAALAKNHRSRLGILNPELLQRELCENMESLGS
jgi:hypothetical protein